MIVPFGERDYYAVAAEHRDRAARDARRRRGRSRRLLRPASAAGAAQAALRREAARDRPRLRLARRHALALRRAGLHGDGDARREEHAGRLAQSLPARARARRRRRRSAPSRWRRSCRARCRGSRRRSRSGRSASSASAPARRPTWCRRRSKRSTRRPPTACCNRTGREAFDAVRMLKDADPAPLHAGERRRVSAVAVRRRAAGRSRS